MVLKGVSEEELKRIRRLDPHFHKKEMVQARFLPTKQGWQDALNYMDWRAIDEARKQTEAEEN